MLILCNSTYIRSLEQANSQQQKVEQKGPETRKREKEGCINSYRVLVEVDEKVVDIDSGDGYAI